MENEKKKKPELSEEAKEARRAYNREYYRRNKERMAQAKAEYWERKAAKAAGSNG